jgi:predicted nucleotidyltransferase
MDQTTSLPAEIRQGIDGFLNDARQAFGEALVSAVLFGSAAEGRLRSTSDVNLLLVLKRFDRDHADLIRDPFRAAHAAIRLDVMFILESELEPAMDAFAVKFSDIISRRRVLFGTDPFANLIITPKAILLRTKQVLINLTLRLRERYVLISLREEQLAFIIADVTGPLRACAATLLKLQGRPAISPKKAMSTMIC